MKKVLLVEDTIHLLEEIADLLRLEGYWVTVANNAMQALELLPELKPELIITDLLMPVMDGFELIQQIMGANRFLHKPCKGFELVTVINELLR